MMAKHYETLPRNVKVPKPNVRIWDVEEDDTVTIRTVKLSLSRKDIAAALGYPGLAFQQTELSMQEDRIIIVLQDECVIATDRKEL